MCTEKSEFVKTAPLRSGGPRHSLLVTPIQSGGDLQVTTLREGRSPQLTEQEGSEPSPRVVTVEHLTFR